MKFKLLLVAIIGFFNCDVIRASEDAASTQLQLGEHKHIKRVSELWHAHNQGISVYQEIQDEIDHTNCPCCDYHDFVRNSDILNKEAINIENHIQALLINSCQARSAITIRNHDRWCYYLPRYLCCIPLTCFYRCKGVDTGRYDRAEFNVLKAIAIVEKDIQQDIKR